jgi:hypothetical protein
MSLRIRGKIDYYEKYNKLRREYLVIKKELNKSKLPSPNKYELDNSNKYAIIMFCIHKEHYVLGACIAAYIHKLFIKQSNNNIDLVIMCDKYIYDNYKSTLEHYFDRVIKISLRHFELSSKYEFCKHKYSSWMGYSLNKWKSLKFVNYKKVLFLDIDILPSNTKFYDLFKCNTPAVYIHDKDGHCCFNAKLIPKPEDTKLSFDQYINNLNTYGSLDGGIVLLEPNLDMYKDYVKETNKLFKNGIYSHCKTGPDETSLFYYFLVKDIPIYDICVDYAVIPWDNPKYVGQAKSYNFLSFIKPWTKPKFFSWEEEMIWRYIFDRMPKKGKLKQIFEDTISDSINIYKFFKDKLRKRYYNQDYIKKYQGEFNQILQSTSKLERINKLDEKIKIDKFGILKTDEIISALKKNNFKLY